LNHLNQLTGYKCAEYFIVLAKRRGTNRERVPPASENYTSAGKQRISGLQNKTWNSITYDCKGTYRAWIMYFVGNVSN